MTPAENFLSRVQHRFTGRDHGIFKSTTRRDKHWSGTFRILADGRLLIFDHGGDSVDEILGAIGLELWDLFPENTEHQGKPKRQAFPATDVLRALHFEVLIVLTASADLITGKALSQIDHDRLVTAVGRIRAAARGAGL